MIKTSKRNIIEVLIVVGVLLVFVASSSMRSESAVGKSPREIMVVASEFADYPLAQKLYEMEKVHGASSEDIDFEAKIYPEMRVEAEIARVENLLIKYPTYPPLLALLVELHQINGNQEKSNQYKRELIRLDVVEN